MAAFGRLEREMKVITVKFDQLADLAFGYLQSLYQPESRFPYPLQAGNQGTLLGTSFACFLAHLIGRTEDLPGRTAIEREFKLLPLDSDGWIESPDMEVGEFIRQDRHDPDYLRAQGTFFVRTAARCFGLYPVVPLPWVKRLAESEGVCSYLDGLDWSNPWLVSNLDMFLGAFLLEWAENEPECSAAASGVRAYFDWHDQRMNQATGFWGNHEDLLNAMAGGFHIILHYDYAGREYFGADGAVRAALELIWHDGLYGYGGGGGSCEDLDGVDILMRLGQRSSADQNQIRETLARIARRILSTVNSDGGFPWRLQPSGLALVRSFGDVRIVSDWVMSFTYRLMHRSHYDCLHYYSSFSKYPFKISKSDIWSTWFRLLAVALIAKRYPELFSEQCSWTLPSWPGLGYYGDEKRAARGISGLRS